MYDVIFCVALILLYSGWFYTAILSIYDSIIEERRDKFVVAIVFSSLFFIGSVLSGILLLDSILEVI